MVLSRIKQKLIQPKEDPQKYRTYSQSGEDAIVSYLLSHMNVPKPFYMDIGCHDAIHLNNTYLFYKRGFNGICVEANPMLAKKFKQTRPRDQVINKAVVADDAKTCEFYILGNDTMSTTSPEIANDLIEQSQHTIKEKVILETVRLPELINASPVPIDFLSLDIEINTKEMLEQLPADKKPKVLCVETIGYINDDNLEKQMDVIQAIMAQGYGVYADTNINTIFVQPQFMNFKLAPII